LGIVIREPEEVDCILDVAFYRGYLSSQQMGQFFELAKQMMIRRALGSIV
jgi:hypothetical protein